MTLRPATRTDLDAVSALAVLEEATWVGEPEAGADEVSEWIDDEGGVTAGVVAVDDGGGGPWVALARRARAVVPADPARTGALAAAGGGAAVFVAVPAGPVAVADEGPRGAGEPGNAVARMPSAGDTEGVGAFERHGLRPRRSSFPMSRPAGAGPLPAAEFPDGV